MFNLLYLVDSAFHLGIGPSTPTSLMADQPNASKAADAVPKPARLQMLAAKMDPTPARFQMLAIRYGGANPPPTNPER